MGGDLNLKKSWHVNLMSNQKKVWQAEKDALDERKKVEQIKREREEERAIEELQKLQQSAGTAQPLIPHALQWMYQGGSSGSGNALDNEAFLLGKRRIDSIVLKKEPDSEKALGDVSAPAPIGTSLKDIGTKANLDPLTAIERQKNASLQKAMSDPVLRRRLMKEMNKEKEKEEKRHRKHRRDGEDRDREHRSKKRRYSEDEDDHRRSHRSHRRRTPSDSKSKSRSPSPYTSKRREDSNRYSSRIDKPRRRSRSRSPYGRRHEQDKRSARDRSRSPFQERQDNSRRYRDRNDGSGRDLNKDREADRAAKLAAMQSSASELEDARNRRLAEMEARDTEEREKEEKKRALKGDRFVGGLRKQAESVGLGDRLQRSRGGLARPDDD